MGLFDLFKKSENNNDVIGTIEDGLKIAQVVSEAYVDLKSLKEVEKISFKDIKSLNDAFNQLVPSLTAIYEEANKEGTGLYKLTNSLKEKNVFSVNEKELASTALKLSSGKSVACVHPAVLVVAVTVVAIEKEVEIIHDECDRILTFLKNDKESQIEGDITTLNNTIDGYKYNWNNKEFCQNHHKLVLDIKRSAEQNCIFYQKQINTLLASQKKDVASKSTEARQKEFENYFRYYQLSLYLLSYASFLEVLLLGNFEENYLHSIEEKLHKSYEDYNKLYADALDKLELIANNSTESKALKGLGGLMQKVKKVDWVSKTGKNLEDKGNKQKLDSFVELDKKINLVFVDKIQQLVFLNDPKTEIYFDKDDIIFCQK